MSHDFRDATLESKPAGNRRDWAAARNRILDEHESRFRKDLKAMIPETASASDPSIRIHTGIVRVWVVSRFAAKNRRKPNSSSRESVDAGPRRTSDNRSSPDRGDGENRAGVSFHRDEILERMFIRCCNGIRQADGNAPSRCVRQHFWIRFHARLHHRIVRFACGVELDEDTGGGTRRHCRRIERSSSRNCAFSSTNIRTRSRPSRSPTDPTPTG